MPPVARSRFTWLKFSPLDLLKVLSGLAVLAGLLLHLIGAATHTAYLREWGLDSALFPRPVDRVLIAGFTSLVVSGINLWPAVLENIAWLALLSLGLSAYWWGLSYASQAVDAMDVAPKWLTRLPRWVPAMFVRFVLIFVALIVVPIAIWATSLLLAQPLVLAERSGKEHAQRERKSFKTGCTAVGNTPCIEIRRGTDLVGRGLLIDSAVEYIAFYDPQATNVRVVPRQGTEMVVQMRP